MAKNLKNLIILIIVIAAVSIGGYFIYKNNTNNIEGGTTQGNLLSPQAAAEKAINFINQNLLSGGVTASIIEVVEDNGLYKIELKVQEEEHTSYVTKDGKTLFIQGIDMDEEQQGPESSENQPEDIPKQERPDVKLFIMSYCPYGLQSQKMFLPVYELLGNKAEMGIYFVNYIMHGEEEIEENIRQYCIQKEERQKLANYLNCFVKDGDFEKCLIEAGIDKGKLSSCSSATDKEYNIYSQYQDEDTWLNGNFPRFDVHTDLNQQYGVRGSPTVILNGKTVSINPRSPETFKQILCQAFNSPPEECSQALSESAFSPGFGLEEGASSGGDCGP